ncbi:hypothetical protein KY385_00440 [Candidatus Parcubacteria bacterium]|nr:hypothetical protein [Candidatus Parcubacteria bacterium]
MSVTHYLRFGTHAESKYFLGNGKDMYDSIIFNGNMVAYTQSAIAAFIINTHEKGFLIDPQTHAFQHDLSYLKSKNSKGEEKIKQSIQQLADMLGNPVLSKLESSLPVTPSDFGEQPVIDAFAEKVIKFQSNIIDTVKEQDDWKYLKFKLKDQKSSEPAPSGLIAPYFYMSEVSYDRWLDINVKLINASIAHSGESELMAQLVIAKDVLTSPEDPISKIIEEYGNSEAKAVLIWVDQFNTVNASKTELAAFRRLAEGLKSKGKRVIDLYGGYFSVLLSKKEILDGVCHGLEYGESRAVKPVGGGIPMAKYYFYPLHYRMRFTDFLTVHKAMGWGVSKKSFNSKVCSCENCEDGDIQKFGITTPVRIKRKSGIVTLNYPTQETKDRSLIHYLNCKRREFKTVQSKSIDELKKELIDSINTYENVLGIESVSHLNRWNDTLS